MNGFAIRTEERERINAGRWFSSLSPTLRHDILRAVVVRRFAHGEQIAAQGALDSHWMGCAQGAVRVCSATSTGKQRTIAYMEPGTWFADVAIVEGGRCMHDCFAHGDTTVLLMPQSEFRALLATHVELYGALLQLQAQCIRSLAGTVDDLKTLSLRDRLIKLLVKQVRRHGVAHGKTGIRIGFELAQEELGRLLGASRQRINEALRSMEKEGLLCLDARGIVILDLESLKRGAECDWPQATPYKAASSRQVAPHAWNSQLSDPASVQQATALA